MSTRTPTFSRGPLRIILTINNVLQWSSSVVVLGFLCYFISMFARTGHMVYEVTLATVNVSVYGLGIMLPTITAYKGHFLPIDVIFSYLWLTAFIFATQDYTVNDCSVTSPPDTAQCGKKHALQSFAFLAFIFSFTAIPLNLLLYLREASAKPTPEEVPAPATVKTVEKEEEVVPESSAAAAAAAAV